MLPLRPLILLFFLVGNVLNPFAQRTLDSKSDEVTARARVFQQKYCRADADLFTISLKLKVEVANSSKVPVYLVWPLIPWVGKVASGVNDAQSGRFLYEITASHYPQKSTPVDRLKIEPGKKEIVQSGYDLVARYNPAFSYPGSLSAGRYALVLLFKPEEERSKSDRSPAAVENVTTDPFVIEVPKHPTIVDCEASAKTP